MQKALYRKAMLPLLLAAVFILLDLLLDRYFGGFGRLDWPHLLLAVSVLLVSFFLLNRAVDAASRAERVLQQSRDELEGRVAERTSQFEEVNRALQAEIDERRRIEAELRSARNLAESEKRHLEAMLQALPVGVVITDAQGGILLTNGMDERIWGPRPVTRDVGDHVQYKAWWADSGKPVEPHEWASAQATERGVAVHGQVLEIERFDGGRRFIFNSAVPVRDAEGCVVGSAIAIQDITELRHAEQELRTSEETARALMDALTESAVLIDTRGIVLASNATAAQRLGATVEALVGSSLFDFFSPDVAAHRRPYLDAILQTPQPLRFVDERAGRTYDNRVHPVLDAKGGIVRLAVFGQDITERIQAETLLRDTIGRLEYTQAAAGAGSWDWDIPSGRLEWSPKTYELFGLERQTTHASFDDWRSVLHPEDLAAAEERIRVALAQHSELESEYRIILPNGEIRWISALGRGAYDDRDQPIRMSGICLDVTDRKRGEENIRRLSSFPQLNPNPVLEVDALGTITFRNPATIKALERLGLSDAAASFFPGDLSVILQALQRERDSSFEREVRVAGATFAETIHVIPASAVARIYCFDITERVRAEEALRTSEEKYRLLFQNMAEGFALYELICDDQGNPADWRILEVNDAYQRHTGLAREQITGRRISELFPAAIPEYLPRFAAVVGNQVASELETYATAVGRHQRVSTFPTGGRRFASIIEDITQRKKSEEALRQTQAELALDIQKRTALEERQRLARELHDSVSQALYGISLGVHTALAQLDTDRRKTREALDYALSLAHAGLMEMRALIFELRPESLEREGLVAALTKQAEAVHARYEIEVALSVCDEPDVPLSTKEVLYRIAQEALQNAARHARADRIAVRLTREPAALRLEVRDNGVGFDPTAAYPGHLGLRSMYERAERVGGTLDILSAPGSETEIRVRVPIPA